MRRMRTSFLLVLGLGIAVSGCSLPGQQIFAPAPVAPDAASIAAAGAFAGRVPLVTIAPGTKDFTGPLAQAVAAARAIKPDVMFDVEIAAPAGASPAVGAKFLTYMGGTGQAVRDAIIADGVAPDHVVLTAATATPAPDILVLVK
jgi:hypothetical protein